MTLFAPLAPFLDPLALAIVGGGTLAATLLRCPLRDVGRAVTALPALGRRGFSATALLEQAQALAKIARRHGVLELDRSVIADPDLAACAEAAVDGRSPAEIELQLQRCLLARAERHRAAADVWSAAAEAAPAMGMIGTLVGLVRMFTNMQNVDAIGAGMAVALLTTLYGAVLANLVALPIAARLKRLSREELSERSRLAQPLAALAQRSRSRLHEASEAA